MKKKVRVFLSFEFGKDNDNHRNFYTQAKKKSCYEIIDCSLNEEYQPNPKWLNKARSQIKKSDIVIVMLGQDTQNAIGVEKEVGEAHQLKRPIFQVRPKRRTYGEVRGAGEVVPWKWKRIDAKIDEKLSERT